MKKEELQKEISLKDRECFFGLYWGQRIVKYGFEDWDTPNTTTVHGMQMEEIVHNKDDESYYCYLLLTPTSMITDEQKLWIIINIYYHHVKFSAPNDEILKMWDDEWIKPKHTLSDTADYLRGEGIALDWNGHTVEEMESQGIIKLKEA